MVDQHAPNRTPDVERDLDELRRRLLDRVEGWSSASIEWPADGDAVAATSGQSWARDVPLEAPEADLARRIFEAQADGSGAPAQSIEIYLDAREPEAGLEVYRAASPAPELASRLDGSASLTGRLAHLEGMPGLRDVPPLDAALVEGARRLDPEHAAALLGERGAEASRRVRADLAREAADSTLPRARLAPTGPLVELLRAWHPDAVQGELAPASAGKPLMVAASSDPAAAAAQRALPELYADLALDLLDARFGAGEAAAAGGSARG